MKLAFLPLLALGASIAAAAPATAQTFSGPYAGVQLGWSHTEVGSPNTDAGRADIDRSKDAFVGGVFAGYNYRASDHIVLSAEAGFNLAASDSVRRAGNGTAASIDPDYAFDLGVRAGYLVNDKTLVYARGGYENLRASVRLVNGTSVTRDHDTFDGWSVGGGVERALTDRISARAEYRYSDLGSGNGKFDRHQALLGVAYHF